MLNEFFAVTTTSIYRVTAKGPLASTATKIARHGQSLCAVGQSLSGSMVAVCSYLQAYDPESHEKLEENNTIHWRGHSSPIIALFATEAEAQACFNETDHKLCDPRWLKETKDVLAQIGDDHSSFYICHWPDLELLAARRET